MLCQFYDIFITVCQFYEIIMTDLFQLTAALVQVQLLHNVAIGLRCAVIAQIL